MKFKCRKQKNKVSFGKDTNISMKNMPKYNASDKERFIDRVTNKMNITEDIINGAPVISIVGRKRISIENYKGIHEYSDEKVVVQTKNNRISIIGDSLTIDYYYDHEMRISGKINSIEYS